jgi:hypothetical protein
VAMKAKDGVVEQIEFGGQVQVRTEQTEPANNKECGVWDEERERDDSGKSVGKEGKNRSGLRRV